MRTGEPAPGPVTALRKEGVAERLEIQALARAEVAELIEAALGGPVEGLTKERLWQLSRGNILYLRELVRGGRQTGDLACSDGMWRCLNSGVVVTAVVVENREKSIRMLALKRNEQASVQP